MENEDRLLNTDEAAEYLGVTPQYLRVCRMGRGRIKLPYIKVGCTPKYRKSELDRYLRDNTVMG